MTEYAIKLNNITKSYNMYANQRIASVKHSIHSKNPTMMCFMH